MAQADDTMSLKPLLVLGQPTKPYSFEDRTFDTVLSEVALAAKSEEYSFDFGQFFDVLATEKLGRSIVFGDIISSTQDFVRKNGGIMPDGSICFCNAQTNGHGRKTNTWTSPRGCLLVTFTRHFQAEVGPYLPLFQYLVGIAVVESVANTPQKLRLCIKWPNDIYTADHIKIGGALCEAQHRSSIVMACGIGLNVANREPTTCLNELVENRVVPDSDATNEPFAREVVLARLLNTLEPMMNEFERNGFDPFLDRYLGLWIHTGQELTLKTEENEDGPTTRVRVIGINRRTGSLMATDGTGSIRELNPDLSSLDLFGGLLIAKTSAV